MENFVFKNPTEIIFGRGTIAELGSRIGVKAPILFLYGGGSIIKNGVYEQVKKALAGRNVLEFGGIEANPEYETCLKALKLAREKKAGFILAVGGGSTLDAAKFVAAAAKFKGANPWSILQTGGANVKSALPVGTVLTLPAAGSEANANSVISRAETREKLCFSSKHVYPKFSILDPETTYTLPVKQLRNGIVDSFAHVMEQYMTRPAATPLQDRFAEGIIRTLIEISPALLGKKTDYDARASLMFCATLALNGLIGCGMPQDWATHMIGHELTAFYGLDHAETLAIIMPGIWKHELKAKKKKLEQFGKRIFGVRNAEKTIKKTEKFFRSIGMPTKLSDCGINAKEAAEKIRERFAERKASFGENSNIGPKEAYRIVKSRA